MAKWPTCGHSGYITPAVSAGTKKRNGYVAHMSGKWLHHPCPLGGPERSARGQKSGIASWPTCGQSGYVTLAVLGVPNAQRGDKRQKLLSGPHVSKGATSPLPSWASPTISARKKIRNGPCCPHVGKVATSPLPSWGSPTISARTKIRNGPCGPHVGKEATSPLPSWGSPTLSAGENSQKWLCPPHLGKVATSPLPSWGSPTLSAGTKVRNSHVAHM